MSLITMSTATMERFDAICKTVAERGSGLTMKQIGDAGALARELAESNPDPDRVEFLENRLGLSDDSPSHP